MATEPQTEAGLTTAFIDSLMDRIYKDGQGEPMRTSMEPEEVEQALRAIAASARAIEQQAGDARVLAVLEGLAEKVLRYEREWYDSSPPSAHPIVHRWRQDMLALIAKEQEAARHAR